MDNQKEYGNNSEQVSQKPKKTLKEIICTRKTIVICAVSLFIILVLIFTVVLVRPTVMFNTGKRLINEENYEKAIEVLKNSGVDESENYITYANALLNIANKNYDDGIKTLKELGEFEKSGEYLSKAYYLKAEGLLAGGEYSSAIEYYQQANGYEDSDNKITAANLLIAEEYYQDGELVTAKTEFEKLPPDFQYNEISVSSRLATLEKYKDFVDMVGEWNGSDGEFSVRQIHTSTGLWDEWTNTFTNYFNVTCKINEDGSVTLNGKAKFFTYTNFSSLSSGLKTREFEVPFSVTVGEGESIPSDLVSSYPAVVANSGAEGNANLTYSDGKIKLSFVLDDDNYSINFTRKYKSTITYSKL